MIRSRALIAVFFAAAMLFAAPALSQAGDPNFDRAHALPIQGGVPYQGMIGQEGEAHWYVFYTAAPDTEVTATVSASGDCQYSSWFYLYDGPGPGRSTAYWGGAPGQIVERLTSGVGPFWVDVEGQPQSYCPGQVYTLTVTPAAAVVPNPPGSGGGSGGGGSGGPGGGSGGAQTPRTPATPSNLSAKPISTRTVHLSWSWNDTARPGQVGFEVKIVGSSTPTRMAPSGSATLDWDGLKAGHGYCFQVRMLAISPSGPSSAWSKKACATTRAPKPQVMPGRVCMINDPTGILPVSPFGHHLVGHVGWAFLVSARTNMWEFGANEGLGRWGHSKTWYTVGKWSTLLQTFKSKYAKNGYKTYRCESLSENKSVQAQATAKRQQGKLYLIPTNDCLSNAVDVMEAYGARLPSTIPGYRASFLSADPDYYYSHLAGFERAKHL